MSKISDYLVQVEEKYGLFRPKLSVPEYSEASYDGKTDDEIKDLVQSKLSGDLNSKKTELTYKNKSAIDGLDSEAGVSLFQRDKLISDIEKMFDKKKQDVSDESLKRGLARSSIALGEISDNENDRIYAKTDVLNDYSQRLIDIEKEKNLLNSEYEEKVSNLENDFQDKFLVEVEKEISNREKEKREVKEYNDEVKKKISGYEADQAALDLQFEENLRNMNSVDKEKMLRDKFNTVVSYYKDMDKDKIEKSIKEDMDVLRANLGNNADMVWAYLKFKNVI